jgi:hypothetical protein
MSTIASLRRELSIAKAAFVGALEQSRGEISRLRSTAAPSFVPPLNLLLSAPQTWAAMPAALTGFGGSFATARKQDLSGHTQARFRAMKLGTAGTAGAKIYLRYAAAFSSTPGDWLQAGASGQIALAIDTTNALLDSGWVALAAAAQSDIFLAVLGDGGNGATAPVFGLVWVELKGGPASEAADTIGLQSYFVQHEKIGGAAATATFRLNTNGDIEKVEGATTTVLGAWISNPANAASYECRATLTEGDTPTGSALGSWLALSSSRSWTLTQSVAGTKSCTLSIDIRLIGGEATSTALISLLADWDSGV